MLMVEIGTEVMEECKWAGPTIGLKVEIKLGVRDGVVVDGAEIEADELGARGDREGVGEGGVEDARCATGDLVRCGWVCS